MKVVLREQPECLVAGLRLFTHFHKQTSRKGAVRLSAQQAHVQSRSERARPADDFRGCACGSVGPTASSRRQQHSLIYNATCCIEGDEDASGLLPTAAAFHLSADVHTRSARARSLPAEGPFCPQNKVSVCSEWRE